MQVGLVNRDTTGEVIFSLFAIIEISLTLSWITAISVTQLMGHYFCVTENRPPGDVYSGVLFRGYAWLLHGTIRVR
ncbi:MAG: hypothetical protein AAGC86_09725 [Pseudomonadota bacterium]